MSGPQVQGRLLKEEAVDAAFAWMTGSSEDIAASRANVLRKKFLTEKVFARLFLVATGSVESRKMWATDHDDYAKAMDDYHQAVETWELHSDQRSRCQSIIETYRTQEATERAIGRMR